MCLPRSLRWPLAVAGPGAVGAAGFRLARRSGPTAGPTWRRPRRAGPTASRTFPGIWSRRRPARTSGTWRPRFLAVRRCSRGPRRCTRSGSAGMHAKDRTRRQLPAAGRAEDHARAGALEVHPACRARWSSSTRLSASGGRSRWTAARWSKDPEPDLARLLDGALGRRHAGGDHHRLQRQDLARHRRPPDHRGADRHRALPPAGVRAAGDRGDHRRSPRPTRSRGRAMQRMRLFPTPSCSSSCVLENEKFQKH